MQTPIADLGTYPAPTKVSVTLYPGTFQREDLEGVRMNSNTITAQRGRYLRDKHARRGIVGGFDVLGTYCKLCMYIPTCTCLIV